MVRCSHLSTLLGSFAQATTKVLQFPIKARGQQFKSIIFEGVKSADVARQIGVKAKYGLTVTTKEKRAMLSVLRACPAQAVPER